MKITKLSKARAAARKHNVVRLVTESHKDYRWWRFQDVEPAEGYVVDTWVTRELAYPRPAAPVTRLPKHAKLSRRALRRRLHQRGVRGEVAKELLALYSNRPLVVGAGSPNLKKSLSYPVWKAVTRHVRSLFLVLDEFAFYMPSGLHEFYRHCRALNIISILAPTVESMNVSDKVSEPVSALSV